MLFSAEFYFWKTASYGRLPMNESSPILVHRLEELYLDIDMWAGWNHLDRLFWFADGRGVLLRGGSTFQLKQHQQGGWLLVMNRLHIQYFLNRHPEFENSLLLEGDRPVIDFSLGVETAEKLDVLAPQLKAGIAAGDDPALLQSYVDIILMRMSISYAGTMQIAYRSYEAECYRKVRQLVRQHFRTRKSSVFYADSLHLSVVKLNAICNRISGKNLLELLNERRITEAEILLITTQMPVKQIALELGYDNTGHFSSYFKKYKGMSPSGYRGLAFSGGKFFK